ncbi:hypothetical protein QQ045_001477 [Rhodiola kirilowii]
MFPKGRFKGVAYLSYADLDRGTKACEIFILEMTIRLWLHAEENKRCMLQKNDIAAAIKRTDIFDFLVDIVPRDEMKEEVLGMVGSGVGGSRHG